MEIQTMPTNLNQLRPGHIGSILTCENWTTNKIQKLFEKADNINKYNNTLSNKILINAFFEPSTRTSLSFECAMKRLGGQVINFKKDSSSIKKGESFEDTIKTLSIYGDLMVLRHPQKNMINLASTLVDIPIINGGDGAGEHPTQALLDLYTIYKHFGKDFNKKIILFVGDLKNSRTIHSLLLLIHLYPEMKIYILAYIGLEPSNELLNKISIIHNQKNILVDCENIDFKMFDVVYITRLQKERLTSINQYSSNFRMTNELANKMKPESIIMHPLPRNEELDINVDGNFRCHYFKQMKYGVVIRMALILDCLDKKRYCYWDKDSDDSDDSDDDI